MKIDIDEIMENIMEDKSLCVVREALDVYARFNSDDIEMLDELADEISCKRQHIEHDDEEISCTYCGLDRYEENNKLIDVGDGEYVCELCIKCEGLTVHN